MASYLPTPKSKQPKPEKIPEPVKPPEPPKPEPTPAVEKPARRRGLPEWAKGGLSTLTVALVVLLGVVAFALVSNLVGNGKINLNPFSPSGGGEKTPLPPGVTPTVEIPVTNQKPWNGVDRISILVMGLDYREGGPEVNTDVSRTDTMAVLSLDPIAKTAVMLSIPRDTYVDIPGYGFDKINKAYFYAEKDRLPIGGPGLAMQTVENLLGIPIDYYAVVDFNSFTVFVDSINGIDVYVPFDNMIIDPVGPEDVKQLRFGWNHLTGSEALAFARARYTEGGDFDRAARTQQVILAIRDKILSLNMVATLLAKAPGLFDQFSRDLKTNLTIEQILQLAWVAKDVKRSNIHQGILDKDTLLYLDTIDNEAVSVPNLEKVHELVARLFASGGPLGYATPPADMTALALKENAKIEVVNGTYTGGLARATRDFLVSQGIPEANITFRDATEQELTFMPLTTLVTDFTGRPYTVQWLFDLMGLSPANLTSDIRFDSSVDVQIFLKYDWKIPGT
jgi:polyisoprenyl-teichoic acid--peptidoglycan teichoic acid transferase